MSGPAGTTGLIVTFPAAGAGSTTLEPVEKLAARRGMDCLNLRNPASVEALTSGEWPARCVAQVGRACGEDPAGRVLLIGHSMGGLSAVCLRDGLTVELGRPAELLLINTPCPDPCGRIPTMSHMTDVEIAEILAHDRFPQDLLGDEAMLAEIADGLRHDAAVADRLSERVSRAAPLDNLHVLSARGDAFIPPERCAAWHDRVSGEFHLTVANGGHSLDESLNRVLERAVDAVLARAQLGVV